MGGLASVGFAHKQPNSSAAPTTAFQAEMTPAAQGAPEQNGSGVVQVEAGWEVWKVKNWKHEYDNKQPISTRFDCL